MLSAHELALILLSLSLVAPTFERPATPLNERPAELAWEAWLLVDQSPRPHGAAAATLRRRITPKSVFIAPTFSPELLPACADGYKSDVMGRCIKIIPLNPTLHFNFLLEKLNTRFAAMERGNVEEGPLQLNIPLLEVEEKGEETEVAIVVTPKHHEEATLKMDIRRRNGSGKFDRENVAAMLGVSPEEVEMTTIAELSSTSVAMTMSTILPEMTTTTTTEGTTDLPESTTTTTEAGTTEMTEQTTEPQETTTEGNALFFLRI